MKKWFLLIIGAVAACAAALFWFRRKRGVVVESLTNKPLSLDNKIKIALNQVLINEGGLVNNPADSGGLTNFGISQKYHPNEDIENMTVERALEIYRVEYVEPMLPYLTDDMTVNQIYQIVDCAINCGVARCKQLLGRVTAEKDFKQVRKDYYASIATGNKSQFLNGWLKRVNVNLV